jgi:predicted RNA binding protein YcfA (HicA-like mRNA interferase family)
VKVREAIQMVLDDGWLHVRTTGSHRHYRHPAKPGTVTIPGHPNDDLAKGTELSIHRQAGLERKRK